MPSEAERPSRNDVEQAIRKAMQQEWHNDRAIYSASIAVMTLFKAAAPSPASHDEAPHVQTGNYDAKGTFECCSECDWTDRSGKSWEEHHRQQALDEAVRLVDRMTCHDCSNQIPKRDESTHDPCHGDLDEMRVCTAKGRAIIAALAEKGLLK